MISQIFNLCDFFFELWSILYSTGVNSELGTYRFCKPDSELTSEIGDSIQKHAGSRCAAAVRGVDGEAPHQKRKNKFSQIDEINVFECSYVHEICGMY